MLTLKNENLFILSSYIFQVLLEAAVAEVVDEVDRGDQANLTWEERAGDHDDHQQSQIVIMSSSSLRHHHWSSSPNHHCVNNYLVFSSYNICIL